MAIPLPDLARAKSNGDLTYISNHACKNGHAPIRYTSTRNCVECQAMHGKNGDKKAEYIRNGRRRYIEEKSLKPWKRAIINARTRAKKSGIPFDLTNEWAIRRWTGKCEFSGITFDTSFTGQKGCRPFSVSIDQKEPSKGYTQENCWFILFAYNAAKGSGSLDDLKKLFGFKGGLNG